MITTLLSGTFDTLRHFLMDYDPAFRQYSDGVLTVAVRSALMMNKLEGFVVAIDNISIDPPITDPNDYALLVYEVVKSFVVARPDKYSYDTRAVKESFGGWQNLIWEVEKNIHKLKNREYLTCWQHYTSWVEGMSGLPSGDSVVNVEIRAPFATVQISNGGATVT